MLERRRIRAAKVSTACKHETRRSWQDNVVCIMNEHYFDLSVDVRTPSSEQLNVINRTDFVLLK